MARTVYQGNDTDIEITITDRYGNVLDSVTFTATFLDQNGNPIAGATNLAPTWDTTLLLYVVTIPGSATASEAVGSGYTLELTFSGAYAGHAAESIPCLIAIRGQS